MSIFNKKFKTHYDRNSVIPWYKGFCYIDLPRNQVVVTIMGLNVIVRVIYLFIRWIRFPYYDLIDFYGRQLDLRIKRKEERMKQLKIKETFNESSIY